MTYKIVEKRAVEVSKADYIINRKGVLKRMKASLTQFKARTTREINLRTTIITDIEKELCGLE